jgi:hypothetical protein
MDTQALLALFISCQSTMIGVGVFSMVNLFWGGTVNGRISSVLIGMVACFANLAIMTRVIPGVL